MELSKENRMQKLLYDRLAGGRILAIGPPCGIKQIVLHGLLRMGRLWGINLEVTEQEEFMQSTDYVLLFMSGEVRGNQIVGSVSERQYTVTCGQNMQMVCGAEKKAEEKGMDSWGCFLDLMEQLERIRISKPKAVLLMSDMCVYGKVFGMLHALKEEETGYVCHTDSGDMDVQCMRMAEHICFRLAGEEGIPIKIARVDRRTLTEIKNSRSGSKELPDDSRAGEEKLLETVLRILLDGIPGEAYNLPGSGECRLPESREDEGMNQKETSGIPDEEGHSALSPIRIVPDCGKAGRL